MENSLFQEYMNHYIPMMKKRYEYSVQRIASDCFAFYIEEKGPIIKRLLLDHKKTAYMNQHHDQEICVIKERKNDLKIITKFAGEILFIVCDLIDSDFSYTYRKCIGDNIMGVGLEERAVLDRVFVVFQELIENDPAYRLLFVTGQMSFNRY